MRTRGGAWHGAGPGTGRGLAWGGARYGGGARLPHLEEIRLATQLQPCSRGTVWVEGVAVAAGEMSVVQRGSQHNPERPGAGLRRPHDRRPPPREIRVRPPFPHVASWGRGLGVKLEPLSDRQGHAHLSEVWTLLFNGFSLLLCNAC